MKETENKSKIRTPCRATIRPACRAQVQAWDKDLPGTERRQSRTKRREQKKRTSTQSWIKSNGGLHATADIRGDNPKRSITNSWKPSNKWSRMALMWKTIRSGKAIRTWSTPWVSEDWRTLTYKIDRSRRKETEMCIRISPNGSNRAISKGKVAIN